MIEIRSCTALLIALTMFLGLQPAGEPLPELDPGLSVIAAPAEEPSSAPEFRAVWVSTILNLDYPSKPGLSVAELKSEAVSILDGAKSLGMNAVILQVRPSGDAFYKSSIFPWSYYLTGNQGTAPADGFDPLEFWVAEAHKRGLELHAWLNPMRITRGSEKTPKHDLNNLSKDNPARKNPGWVVKYSDGNMYYNPGIPEVRQLIVNGISEIVRNYDVDGIHFDDYFYPGKDFDDGAAFKLYGGKYSNAADWRRDCVTELVRASCDAVKSIRPSARFGISPVAIWANKSNNAYGSDTNGYESYYSQFADTRKWVKTGILDYICPQIYWQIGYKPADYQKVLNWWVDTVKDTGVDLYVGHAAYRCGTSETPGDAWYGTGEMERQLNMNRTAGVVRGSAFFRYALINENKDLCAFFKRYYTDANSGTKLGDDLNRSLVISRPVNNYKTSESKIYILGGSDPSKPLRLNGKLVETRSAEGHFGLMVDLKSGNNVFTLSQDGGESKKITVIRGGASASTPVKMSKAEIPETSVYPYIYNEFRMPGESVTLKCAAPIGATVTVKLNGKTYNMTPATKSKPGGGIYQTTYSYVFKIPQYDTTGKIINLGTPVFTMKYDGKTASRGASGDVRVITRGAPYYAEVTAAVTQTYAQNGTSGGPTGELPKGTRDYITAVTNGGAWVRLGMGQWVQRVDVKRTEESAAFGVSVSAASSDGGARWENISFKTGASTASRVTQDGRDIVYTVYNAAKAQNIKLPANSMFKSSSVSVKDNKAVYTLTPKDDASVHGWMIENIDGGIRLCLKRKPSLASGDRPLSGISIMLDAGHGGPSDTGALGPLGATLCEKVIVLSTTKKLRDKLQALGATISMTRESDVEVKLVDRLAQNRREKPDLFVSIHNNDMSVNVDVTKIAGVAVFYKEPMSKDFARFMYNHLTSDLGRGKRGCAQANLYVCRGQWLPSILIECGFISNPDEFEWLKNDAEQNKLVDSIARGIVEYLR